MARRLSPQPTGRNLKRATRAGLKTVGRNVSGFSQQAVHRSDVAEGARRQGISAALRHWHFKRGRGPDWQPNQCFESLRVEQRAQLGEPHLHHR